VTAGKRRRIRDDDGAGAVLALAIVCATIACALAALSFGSALAARQRLVAAADAGALAAADTLLGVVAGDPCARAAEVAAAHRVTLTVCDVDAVQTRVQVGASVLGVPISAESRAGPPP
jgi:secretion/DNA translocation related TadE-like protein